ncbi:hypothetical protein CFC21_043414 [Triticum aestivum]|uniref:Gnk2-homologous domain-containing protein n=2 Tax=Triticum aestivum TaxID=4565 RepID=A0A9R1FQF0_WHEAT|nr:cysteine-rich receptor-like protein kinase 10 [Triticum aestivum]KAF7032207.1 hypothetical protein CFC21_043414 [Triticum aestivum]
MATTAVLILLAKLLPMLATATDSRWPAADYGLALTPNHSCGDMGRYPPGRAYEANVRHLVATIPAKGNAESSRYGESCKCSFGNFAGESPNLVAADASCCWHPDAKSPDCGACIALAFQEAQRLCPYERSAEAVVDVDGGTCQAYFHDYDIREQFVHVGPSTPPELLPALVAAADGWPASDDSMTLTPSHMCGDMGTYAPGSAYEATLRHLAATIAAKLNAKSSESAGESPNRIVVSAYCSWHPDAESADCSACIALAFREAQRLCPYQRQAEAVVDGGACKFYFHDYDIMEQFQHGDPSSDLHGNTVDQAVGVVAENEENSTRMGWACHILETTIMEIFANLG